MSFITSRLRVMWLSAVFAVVSVCAVGCGDSGANGSGGGSGSYESVTIGGKTWMKRNLNRATDSSWCYNNSPDSCAKYGRLYTWEAAMSACPSGWRLPTREEWQGLVDYAGGSSTGGKKLKAVSGWSEVVAGFNGTDDFGFSALPGRCRMPSGSFFDVGTGYWWSSTESGADYAYSRYMYYYNDYIEEESISKKYGRSVRCVLD